MGALLTGSGGCRAAEICVLLCWATWQSPLPVRRHPGTVKIPFLHIRAISVIRGQNFSVAAEPLWVIRGCLSQGQKLPGALRWCSASASRTGPERGQNRCGAFSPVRRAVDSSLVLSQAPFGRHFRKIEELLNR